MYIGNRIMKLRIEQWGYEMENKNVLVIGGGIAGIQASLDLADKGMQVYLVEKEPCIGGRMSQLDKTFPAMDCENTCTGSCPSCILVPKMIECFQNPNVTIHTYSEVKGIKGNPGDFKISVLRKARHVNEDRCTGCGDCIPVCPVSVDNEFEMGMIQRKAIYLSFPQAIPRTMTIDEDHCKSFSGEECKLCESACKPGAIELGEGDEEIQIDANAVIIATGFDVWDPSGSTEYGYKKYPNVYTAMEFERLLSVTGPTEGHIKRRSDGEIPKKIGFIQCVGSRNPQLDHPYCCSVCCMHASKEAVRAKMKYNDIETYIFYKDLRTFGKGFHEYVESGKSEHNVNYINSDATVQENPESHNPIITYDVAGRAEKMEVDMVVLATTLIPRKEAKSLATKLSVETDEFGFYKAQDILLKPIDTSQAGIFLAGYCHEPMDIPETIAQASGAAARVAEFVLGGENK
jgi:heterodisulfide reductase subunit A